MRLFTHNLSPSQVCEVEDQLKQEMSESRRLRSQAAHSETEVQRLKRELTNEQYERERTAQELRRVQKLASSAEPFSTRTLGSSALSEAGADSLINKESSVTFARRALEFADANLEPAFKEKASFESQSNVNDFEKSISKSSPVGTDSSIKLFPSTLELLFGSASKASKALAQAQAALEFSASPPSRPSDKQSAKYSAKTPVSSYLDSSKNNLSPSYPAHVSSFSKRQRDGKPFVSSVEKQDFKLAWTAGTPSEDARLIKSSSQESKTSSSGPTKSSLSGAQESESSNSLLQISSSPLKSLLEQFQVDKLGATRDSRSTSKGSDSPTSDGTFTLVSTSSSTSQSKLLNVEGSPLKYPTGKSNTTSSGIGIDTSLSQHNALGPAMAPSHQQETTSASKKSRQLSFEVLSKTDEDFSQNSSVTTVHKSLKRQPSLPTDLDSGNSTNRTRASPLSWTINEDLPPSGDKKRSGSERSSRISQEGSGDEP